MNIENKRFKEVRAFLGKTQEEFGAILNIEQGTVSDIERGKSGVSKHVKSVLLEKLNVSEKWWDTGNGKIFTQEAQAENKNTDLSIFSPEYWKDKYYKQLEENNELLKKLKKL
jgi:transcriptional regulator with XRE-family HTH domain